MSANQPNPATVAQLSAHEGNQQEFYYPPQALAENSNIMAYAREKGFANVDELYDWSIQNREQFWGEMAMRFCDWYQPWQEVLDESEKPFFKWFTGGKINVVHNAIDRHAIDANPDKIAILCEPDPRQTETPTHDHLAEAVTRFPHLLKA